MVRQGGRWKIDAFAPVGADPSGQQQSTPVPTPAAGGAR